MNLPMVDEPQRYRGLYVFDFGEWTAVGYTADEIAVLLESERYRDGKVYKIHRAHPGGQLELRGVAAGRFQLESGIFFRRNELDDARADFRRLREAAADKPVPCRAHLHLARRAPQTRTARFVTALVFPAEYEDEVGQWLTAIGFAGGDTVEGGISHVTNYHQEHHTIIERHQLWSRPAIPSRSPQQVLSSVRRAVQR